MTDETGKERRRLERRKLVLLVDAADPPSDEPPSLTAERPRRSGTQRRTGERRVVNLNVSKERRSHGDRRVSGDRRQGQDRRGMPDRRRYTPAAFSREEAGVICAAASAGESPIPCPRCDGSLTLRPPIASAEGTVWQVRCKTCSRCIMIKNL